LPSAFAQQVNSVTHSSGTRNTVGRMLTKFY